MTPMNIKPTTNIKPTVNKQSKNILAQLLATEDISVVHSNKAETASFDIRGRTLTLPVWKDMSDSLYDMLVGHEVGHALYTPYNEEYEKGSAHAGPWMRDAQDIGGDSHGDIAMAYLNIVEDARIEKLMKQKFPGLRRDFVAAYKELMDKDFFGAKTDPSNILIDRINLHFKLGVSAETECGIGFSSAEQVFVDRIADATTYAEVLQIVKDIWEFETENNKPQTDKNGSYIKVKIKGEGEEGEGDNDGDGDEEGEGEGTAGAAGSRGGTTGQMPQAPITHKIFEQKAKDLLDKKVDGVVYYNLPEAILANIVIEPNELAEYIDLHAAAFSRVNPHRNGTKQLEELKALALEDANKFVRSSKKAIAIMSKQFEMKKAADEHKRTSVAKTGVLDLVKMMQYKFSDDIFARNKIIQTGKNHGVCMFVDWSSSMSGCISDTVNQCFLIALFCKKCNIPFEVYAFSSESVRIEIEKMKTPSYGSENKKYTRLPSFTEDYSGSSEDARYPRLRLMDFSLLHLASSAMSMRDLTSALATTIMIIGGCRRGKNNQDFQKKIMSMNYYDIIPNSLRLAGTPLNEAILAATPLVNALKKKAGVQIMNSIFLTDGQGNSLYYKNTFGQRTYFVNQKTKATHDIEKLSNINSTNAILKIHEIETGANVIGFFVYNGKVTIGEAMNFVARSKEANDRSYYGRMPYTPAEFDRVYCMKNKLKKEGFFVADHGSYLNGYKDLYVVRGSSMELDIDSELDSVEVGSSVAKVRSAFRSQMQDSSISKNLLNKFIAQIAV